MSNFICTTCGTQFAESSQPPEECKICTDERQYVGWSGQQWTTLDGLGQSHRNVVRLEELGLYGIGMEPSFAIGHPHYYTSMISWSQAFDCPIFLHAADREWVMRPDPAIEYWDGETKQIGDGLTLIRCGGHFDGGTVLHWPEGAGGKGAILSGDILQVVQDRRWVSFMYSYPNLIPLPASSVRQIVSAVEPFDFDRIYGAWWGLVVGTDAKAAVHRSADRYTRWIQG